MDGSLAVEIKSEAWVKEGNSYMNIGPEFKTFFPDDCFIARGTGRENQNLLETRGIYLEYQGALASVQCFMELRSGGQFRPSNRGAIKDFYRMTDAEVEDVIVFTRAGARVYKVNLIKNRG